MEAPDDGGLTKHEDDDLRRLSFFAHIARLTEWTESRISDLRSHDRRHDVRPPRDEDLPILEPGDQTDPEDASPE
jgi:hypothetical protein